MLVRLSPIIAAVALTQTVVTTGQQSDRTRNPLSGDADAAARGAALYARSCQSCHGPEGQGDRGPALTGRLAHGDTDIDLFQTIRTGVPGTQMPPFGALADEQVWQLVVYVRTLAPPARGDTPPPVPIVLKTRDGQELRGTRLNEDTFSVQLVDGAGRWHFFDKATRAAYHVEFGPVTPARLEHAHNEPANWLMYWGDYQSTHYSALNEITTNNVHRLQTAWTFPLPGASALEATPLVVDGVMFVTQPGVVVALDARTGRQLWRFNRTRKVTNPNELNPFNRGVAIAGDAVLFGTLDAALVAVDVHTGRLRWETQVADSLVGYSLTSAPLVVRDKVLVGITGGEFGARGFLDAYDVATGQRLWRWYAVPGPGEFGNDTWKGDSWQHGGSPMWLTGAYDPALNLVYWTVGNPGPQIDRSARGDLDNLFSDSVVAIDPDTGQRRWHYQFTPNDGHDWDSCQAVVLVDRMWHGQPRKLLLHADRNGFLYVLDRTTGAFLTAMPFVYQNWNAGFDERGRPRVIRGANSTPDGSYFVYPTLGGATNFQAPSYSPITQWLYLAYREGGQVYRSAAVPFEPGRQYIGRATATSTASAARPGEPAPSAGIKALDPETGKTMWDFPIFEGSLTNGVLATAGGVLFAAVRDGNLVALGAANGQPLWHFQTGARMAASPMSYAVNGRQFVAIAAGSALYAFTLAE